MHSMINLPRKISVNAMNAIGGGIRTALSSRHRIMSEDMHAERRVSNLKHVTFLGEEVK